MKHRAYESAINHKCDSYQRGLESMLYKVCCIFWQENKIRTECKWRTNQRTTQTSD